MIQTEALKKAEVPVEGWSQYAKSIGATKKTGYAKDYRVLDY
jgi:hypothetical protein